MCVFSHQDALCSESSVTDDKLLSQPAMTPQVLLPVDIRLTDVLQILLNNIHIFHSPITIYLLARLMLTSRRDRSRAFAIKTTKQRCRLINAFASRDVSRCIVWRTFGDYRCVQVIDEKRSRRIMWRSPFSVSPFPFTFVHSTWRRI